MSAKQNQISQEIIKYIIYFIIFTPISAVILAFIISTFSVYGPNAGTIFFKNLAFSYLAIAAPSAYLIYRKYVGWQEEYNRQEKVRAEAILASDRQRKQVELSRMRAVYDAYVYLQKTRKLVELIDVYEDAYKEDVKKIMRRNEILRELSEYNEMHMATGLRIKREIDEAFHNFRREAALTPNPIVDEDHAWKVFSEIFPDLPISKDKNLNVYAYYAPSWQRDLLKLPEPDGPVLPPPDKAKEKPIPERDKLPSLPSNLETWGYINTWGHINEWEKVNDEYRPAGRYSKHIPTGPDDMNIRSFPMYATINERQIFDISRHVELGVGRDPGSDLETAMLFKQLGID